MKNTETNTSYSSQETLPFSEKPFKNSTGVELPGISHESQQVVLELIEKNRERFHIFFNDKNYHNHFVHHLLGAYSLGASPEQLRRIFDKYASYQKPKPPSTVTITRENWTEHLGNRDLWTDYLKFFDQVIQEDGMEKVFNNFAFHPKMFPRLFSGAFHPLIHLGYGVEFQIPAVLAEGLAEATVHKNWLEKVIDNDYLSYKGGEKKKKVIDIVTEVSTDNQFDFITHDVKEKLLTLLAEKAATVKEISKQWVIQETPEGVREAVHELYEAIIIVYGSTPIRPDKPKIECDFFLMHGLTSMLLLFNMLPYCTLEKRIMLLKSQFATVLSFYIASGRPKFHVDDLMRYTPQKLTEDPNPWLDIIRYSMLEESDTHVLKVIRSLLKAQQEWAPEEKENIYVKVAQLTYDGFEIYGWIKDIGFDEEWH